MKSNFTRAAIISALIINLFSSSVFAAEGQTMRSRGFMTEAMKMHSETMSTELGLTQEQKQKIDQVMNDTKTQAEPIVKCMCEKRKALIQSIFCSQITKEQALCKAKEIAELKYQLEGIMIDGLMQAKCVLTPVQQQKFVELYQNKMMGYQIQMDSSIY